MNTDDNKLPANFGIIVAELRKLADFKQAELAQKLTVDASRISRIESGDVYLTKSEAENLLQAIDTKEAKDFQEFLDQEWEILQRPTFYHPQRDILYKAELTFQKLKSFRNQEDLPTPLYGEANMHEKSLHEMTNYIMRLDHSVAYIGDMGVGKTTAVCVQSKLILSSKSEKGEPPSTALETGAGGTTVCEVRIRQGLQYSLYIEPVEDTEIYKLASELCASIYDSSNVSKESSFVEIENQTKGVSPEISRALRNMTGLVGQKQKLSDGKTRKIDPLKELSKNSESLADLCSEFNQKLSLWKRSRREITYDNMSDMSGLEWLKKVFKDINNGRHEDFSLPKRIDILVPFSPLDKSSYEIEIIDTKGVDQTAIRPDLQACIDDPRTIIVLCSGFNDAPGTSAQGLIEHLNKTGKSDLLRERIGILVLPRTNQAISMKDDSGEKAQTDEDGYEMKSDQVEMLLDRIGTKNIAKLFFNSVSDNPEGLNKFIIDQLENIRIKRISRINEICSAVDYLSENQEEEHGRISRDKVSKRLKIFLKQNSSLPNHDWKIYKYLIEEVETTNARSLWASMLREGSWYNLDVHFVLGNGAMKESRKCTLRIFNELIVLVKNMLGDEDLKPSHVFLKELESNWSDWYNKFINRAYAVGSQIFRSSLEEHSYIWIECAELYGQQRQFRYEVASILQSWFEDSDQEDLYKSLETRLAKMWQTEVLDQLKKIVDDKDK